MSYKERMLDRVIILGIKRRTYLTIIERAFYRDIVHVGVGHCSHLGFLDGGNAAFGVKDEDGDIGLIA